MNRMTKASKAIRLVRTMAGLALCLSLLGLTTPSALAQGRPHVLWSAAGHDGSVKSIALAPDGKMLATSSADRTVKLWRYPSATLIRTLVLPYDVADQVTEIDRVRFTPDGTELVVALDRFDGRGKSTGTVAVFRASDGGLERVFGRQPQGVAGLDVSPDGLFVATAGKGGGVMVWRLADGQRVQTLAGPVPAATDVQYTTAGDRLCAGYADGHLLAWGTQDWKRSWAVTAQPGSVTQAVFSPSGATIATAGDDGTANLFEASTGTLQHTLTVGSALWAVAFSPDGADLASAGQDGAIRLWDAAQGVLLEQFATGPGSIESLRYTRGGAALVSGGDYPSRMIEWNPADGSRTRNLTTLSSNVNRVVYSDDSRLVAVAATYDDTVEVFDARSGKRRYTWKTQTDVQDVAFSPDNRLVAMPGGNDTVVIRRLSDGKKIRTLVGHQENVVGLKFSHDGSLLASGSHFSGTVRLWKTSDWSQVEVIQGGSDLGAFGPFESLSFSPDDTLLGTVAEASPIVIRLADQAVVAQPRVISYSAEFSPDGGLYAVSGGVEDQGVTIFETEGWTATQTLPTGATGVAFSADGRYLLTAQTDALRIWRTSDWTAVDTWDQELGYQEWSDGVLAVAFGPDGAQFAYGRADATLIVARNPNP